MNELLKSDKEAADIKYKGNRKQFEVNLRLDNILTQIDQSSDSPADIHKLVAEVIKNGSSKSVRS